MEWPTSICPLLSPVVDSKVEQNRTLNVVDRPEVQSTKDEAIQVEPLAKSPDTLPSKPRGMPPLANGGVKTPQVDMAAGQSEGTRSIEESPLDLQPLVKHLLYCILSLLCVYKLIGFLRIHPNIGGQSTTETNDASHLIQLLIRWLFYVEWYTHTHYRPTDAHFSDL